MVSVWHRGKAKVDCLLGNKLPRRLTTCESACRFPCEIVEMITAHLTHDLRALKACSLTCQLWYLVVVPLLHHTLILRGDGPSAAHSKLKPLFKLYELGLIPLVKEIRVGQWCGKGRWFGPQAFSRRDLRYFSTFTNVQTLVLERLRLDHFIPDIKRYFAHFSPSLKSIALFKPRCTPRQLSYFLSLFPNLDDIEIQHTYTSKPNATLPDAELVLSSAPIMRGRLVLHCFRWIETWTYLTASCGGPRFRYVDLRGSACCAPLLLEACAETIETLRFNVTDGFFGK